MFLYLFYWLLVDLKRQKNRFLHVWKVDLRKMKVLTFRQFPFLYAIPQKHLSTI